MAASAITIGAIKAVLGVDISSFASGFNRAKRILKKFISITKRGMKLLVTTTVSGFTSIGAAGFKFSLEMNRAMGQVQTLLDGTLESTTAWAEAMRSDVRDMAVEMGRSTLDLASALYQVQSAFPGAIDQMERLAIVAEASTAGNASASSTLRALSLVVKSYGDISVEAMRHVADLTFQTVKLGVTTLPEMATSLDKVAVIAADLGLSLEEMFAVFAAGTGVIGTAARVATQFRFFLVSLQKPTRALAAVIDDLGFSSGRAMIEGLGLGGSIREIREAAERADVPLAKYFSRIQGVNFITAFSGPLMDDYINKLEQMGFASGAMGDAFEKMTQGIAGAAFTYDRIKIKLRSLLEEVGDRLSPAFIKFGEKFIEIIETLEPKFLEFVDEIADDLENKLFPEFEGMQPSIEKIFDSLLRFLRKAWDGFVSLVEGGLDEAWKSLKGAAMELGTLIGETIVAGAATAFGVGVAKMIEEAKKAVKDFMSGQRLPAIADEQGHSTLFTGLAKGGVTSGPQLALIGEEGAEAVVPLTKGDPFRYLAKMLGLPAMQHGGLVGDRPPGAPLPVTAGPVDWNFIFQFMQAIAAISASGSFGTVVNATALENFMNYAEAIQDRRNVGVSAEAVVSQLTGAFGSIGTGPQELSSDQILEQLQLIQDRLNVGVSAEAVVSQSGGAQNMPGVAGFLSGLSNMLGEMVGDYFGPPSNFTIDGKDVSRALEVPAGVYAWALDYLDLMRPGDLNYGGERQGFLTNADLRRDPAYKDAFRDTSREGGRLKGASFGNDLPEWMTQSAAAWNKQIEETYNFKDLKEGFFALKKGEKSFEDMMRDMAKEMTAASVPIRIQLKEGAAGVGQFASEVRKGSTLMPTFLDGLLSYGNQLKDLGLLTGLTSKQIQKFGEAFVNPARQFPGGLGLWQAIGSAQKNMLKWARFMEGSDPFGLSGVMKNFQDKLTTGMSGMMSGGTGMLGKLLDKLGLSTNFAAGGMQSMTTAATSASRAFTAADSAALQAAGSMNNVAVDGRGLSEALGLNTENLTAFGSATTTAATSATAAGGAMNNVSVDARGLSEALGLNTEKMRILGHATAGASGGMRSFAQSAASAASGITNMMVDAQAMWDLLRINPYNPSDPDYGSGTGPFTGGTTPGLPGTGPGNPGIPDNPGGGGVSIQNFNVNAGQVIGSEARLNNATREGLAKMQSQGFLGAFGGA